VTGCCECGDEPSGSGATDLVLLPSCRGRQPRRFQTFVFDSQISILPNSFHKGPAALWVHLPQVATFPSSNMLRPLEKDMNPVSLNTTLL
jgi:hypothetical protein